MKDENALRALLNALGISELSKELASELAELDSEFASVGGLDGVLAGREPAPPPPRPNPALAMPDPTLASRVVEYAVVDEREGSTHPVSPVTVETRAVSAAAGPAWRVAMTMTEHDTPVNWDVVMRAADLRPITYSIGWSLLQFEGRTIGDHLYVSSDLAPKHGGGTRRRSLPEWAFLSPASLWVMLAAAPLDRGWSADVHLLNRTPPDREGFVPLRLRVVGEERLRTATGEEVGCWIVAIEGSADGNTVSQRCWVSRGDPARRVVVRVLEQKEGGARTRRYELASLQRGGAGESASRAASDEPAPPDSLEIDVRRPEARSIESIILKRGRYGRVVTPEKRREIAEGGSERVPPLELLRARGDVTPHTPPEAIARYERERTEYAEDMIAYLELNDAKNEVHERTVFLELRVAPPVDETRPTYLRLTVPPGVQVRLHGEDFHLHQPDYPVPITAPLEKRRKRLVRRLVLTRSRSQGDVPKDRFTAPDGSTIVVEGPAPASRSAFMYVHVGFAFESWEQVAPFTVTYDISAEGLAPVQGSFVVGVRPG